MKDFIIPILVITGSLFGCDLNMSPGQNNVDFQGTTWAMHLKEDSYNYIWLSCDSTYISYDDEIENRYYGRFEIAKDTLILVQEFEDDYHKFGSYPIKKESASNSKYLIQNDSVIMFLGRDENRAIYNNVYTLVQHFDCTSLYEN